MKKKFEVGDIIQDVHPYGTSLLKVKRVTKTLAICCSVEDKDEREIGKYRIMYEVDKKGNAFLDRYPYERFGLAFHNFKVIKKSNEDNATKIANLNKEIQTLKNARLGWHKKAGQAASPEEREQVHNEIRNIDNQIEILRDEIKILSSIQN